MSTHSFYGEFCHGRVEMAEVLLKNTSGLELIYENQSNTSSQIFLLGSHPAYSEFIPGYLLRYHSWQRFGITWIKPGLATCKPSALSAVPALWARSRTLETCLSFPRVIIQIRSTVPQIFLRILRCVCVFSGITYVSAKTPTLQRQILVRTNWEYRMLLLFPVQLQVHLIL